MSTSTSDAELAELRREIEARDLFLARVSTALGALVERLGEGAMAIEELQGFARELAIIAGNEEARVPRRVRVDAAAKVEETVSRWKVRTHGTVTIHTETRHSGDVVGAWDPDQLDTMLGELVSNACKYGRGRPITVRVEGDVTRVRFIVDDEGAGIAGDEPRRFRRGADPDTREMPGFGVGLWLTHLLAEAHGGAFHLARRPSGGTRAVVELPRRA